MGLSRPLSTKAARKVPWTSFGRIYSAIPPAAKTPPIRRLQGIT
jgi:hypothetical protein